jgi:hypothetical protein
VHVHELPRRRDAGLSPWSERALRAVVEAIFARGADAPPPSERIDWVVREVDDFLARVSTRSYAIVLLSLFAVSVLAPIVGKRFGVLASLALADRIHALEALERSGLAPALLAVKALASVHYYEHPDAARDVGFDGQCLLPGGSR